VGKGYKDYVSDDEQVKNSDDQSAGDTIDSGGGDD
jgi:hypothetical protein